MSANIVRTNDSCSVSFGHFVRGSVSDLVSEHTQVSNHGRVNGDQRRWLYQPRVFFLSPDTLPGFFLSLEFNGKQTKIFSRLEFRKACPFWPNPRPIPVYCFLGRRFQTVFRLVFSDENKYGLRIRIVGFWSTFIVFNFINHDELFRVTMF